MSNNMKTESWCGHDIRFVELNGEWYAILKDICDVPCINKETYKMMMKDIVTLLRERYGIPHAKVRMKVGLHSDVFPAVDVDISRSECAITKVIFNDPATIVFWSDNTKTVVKCGDADIFDKEKGLAMAICKKAMGNKGNYYKEFKKWIKPEPEAEAVSIDVGISKLFANWGEVVRRGVNDYFNRRREYREVDFHKYCPKCKYWDIEEIMNPCNECLGEPCNKNSEKPVYYEPDKEDE